jgi:hypothetical protein
VVVYDEIAERWLLSQLNFSQFLCIAVSTSDDPLGRYHLYTFDVGEFPDYFKVGLWPNAYYVSSNNEDAGYTAYAFDRAKMLAGNPNAGFVKFTGETNFLLPADLDGSARPSGGGYFYTFKDDAFHGGRDRIELFRLTPNFDEPKKSSFELIERFPIADFTYTVCGFFNFDCIPQKGTPQRVDAVSEWPMQRFVYREIGSVPHLLGNFTVGGGYGSAGAAIRWFELRGGYFDGNWRLFQEGTQDLGDGLDRFMGSVAIDKVGSIALGYSASSRTDYPSIRYALRQAGDPPGRLRPERTLKAGHGSQTGSNRWGDYTAMMVDPTGGCEFWYTNEYYRNNASSNWKTAIGAFTADNCNP